MVHIQRQPENGEQNFIEGEDCLLKRVGVMTYILHCLPHCSKIYRLH